MDINTLNLEGLGIDVSKLNLDIDLNISLLDNPELFQSQTNTTRVVVGKETRYQVEINGRKFPGTLTCHSGARLTNLSLLEQGNAMGSYKIITGLITPMKLTLEFEADGRKIDMIDFLFDFAKSTGSGDYSEWTRAMWIDYLAAMRMPLASGMQFFFQQMGAREGAYEETIALLQQHTNMTNNFATMPTEKRGKRLRDAWQIGNLRPGSNGNMVAEGLEVLNFEIGTTDPTQTDLYKKHGVAQGFTNLGDAIFKNFSRIVEHHKSAALKEQLAAKNASALTEAQIRDLNASAKQDRDMARQHTNNWGGANRVYTKQQNGDHLIQNQYGQCLIPCGRVTVASPKTGEPLAFNFWKDGRIADSGTTADTSITADSIKTVAGFNEE